MAKDDVTFQVGVNTKDATKSLAKFGKNSSKIAKGVAKEFDAAGRIISSSFGGLGKVFGRVTDSIFSIKGALVTLVAGAGITQFLDSVTDAASRQEDAVQGLVFALNNSADSSGDALKGFEDFASALQDATGLGDEVALEIAGLAKSFGASDQAAKDFATASAELSAVTGKSIEETSRQLVKSLGGLAGELGEISPIFKNLTSDQLKAGDAARVVLENFSGAAANRLLTFSGAVKDLAGRYGDLLESFGRIITENPTVAKIFGKISDGFKELTKFIDKNGDNLRKQFTKSLVEIIKASSKFVKLLEEVFGDLSIDNPFSAMEESAKAIAELIEDIRLGLNEFEKANQRIAREQVKAGALPVVQDAVPGFGDFFSAGGFGAPDQVAIDVELTTNIEEEIKRTESGFEELGDNIARRKFGITIEPNVEPKASDVLRDFAQELEDSIDQPKIDVTVPKPPRPGGLQLPGAQTEEQAKALKKELEDRAKADEEARKEAERIAGIISGAISGALGALQKGAAGATQLFSTGVSAATEVFFPGFGAAAGQLFEILAAGPDAVRDMVDGLVAAIPEVLDNVAQAAPVLVEALVDNLDEFIIAIIKATPAIAKAFAIEVPLALAKPEVWEDVAKSLVIAIAEEITGQDLEFSSGKLKDILGNFNTDLDDTLKDFIDDFNSGLDTLKKDLDSFGSDFSKGLERFPGDVGRELEAAGDAISITFAARVRDAFLEIPEKLSEFLILFEELLLSIGESFAPILEFFTNLVPTFKTIFDELVAGLGAVFEQIRAGLENAFNSFLNSFKESFLGGVLGFRDRLKELFDGFAAKINTAFANLPIMIGNRFNKFLNDLSERLNKATGGVFSGGGGGTVGRITSAIGLQTGGTVPAGFPNDSFGANLTSGELVVPRDDVTELRTFLAEQRRGSGELADSGEMTELLAQIAGNTSGGGGGTITLNEDGLTDLLLDFSRRNERTQVA